MKICLSILTAFVTLTAVAGGLLLAMDPAGDGLHLTTSMLHNTPFKSYLIPGILLLVLVGGVNGLVLFKQLTHSEDSYSWTMAGALVLLGWTIIQMQILDGSSWLQMLFLFVGLFMILLNWQLKGKWVL